MKKFLVDVREVWVQTYEIEAESKEEALQLVYEGDGEIVDGGPVYSHVLDGGKDIYYVSEKK